MTLIALIALVLQQLEPAPDQWAFVIESESGASISIDPTTVETRDGITYAWERWDFSNDPVESDGASIRLMGNRCDKRERGSFEDRSMDKQNRIVTTFRFKKPGWDDVRRGSVGDALMLAACAVDAERRRALL